MEASNCPFCGSPAKWLKPFTEQLTQATERYIDDGEDSRLVLRDESHPITYDVAECTNCKRLIQYDPLGALGEISRSDYEYRLKHSIR